MNNRGQTALDFLMTYGCAILSAMIVIGALGLYFYYQPQHQFKITIEECTKEVEFNFLFNMERLNEKNITFEDFEYATYLYMDDVEVDCSREGIEDCFVYGVLQECEEVEITGIKRLHKSSNGKNFGCNYYQDWCELVPKESDKVLFADKCLCIKPYYSRCVNDDCWREYSDDGASCEEYQCGNYKVEVLA